LQFFSLFVFFTHTQVGEKVLTQVGNQWIPAIITKPINAAGNYGVRFKVGAKVMNYVSSSDQLKRQGVAEARMSAAQRLWNAEQKQRAKSDASLARTPSSIPKPEPKKDEKTVPVSENVEDIMDALINKIIVNEATNK
jgi:hypothetical protein